MSTVTINPTTALKNFLSAEAVVKGFKVQEVKQSKALSNGTELESFKQSMITAEYINHGIKWFNSAEGIKQRKLDGMKLKVYQLGHEAYDIGKAQFYKYGQCYDAHLDNENILKDYVSFVTAEKKQGNDERYSIKGFLKYVNDETVTVQKEKKVWSDTFTSGKGKEAIKCRKALDGTYDLQGNSLTDCINMVELFLSGLKATAKGSTKSSGKELFEALGTVSKTAKAKA